MRVKTCGNCRYSIADLGDLYDPNAKELACANCPALGTIDCASYFPNDNYDKRRLVNDARKQSSPRSFA